MIKDTKADLENHELMCEVVGSRVMVDADVTALVEHDFTISWLEGSY